MKSRWTDQGADQAIRQWGGPQGEPFALLLYTARLIGQDSTLVLHGGGNVSLKQTRRTLLGDDVEAIHVKGSGCELVTLEAEDMPGLDLGYLRRLRVLSGLGDAEMINQLRCCLLDASAPTPSIETLLHAFLPHRFIDHSHADAVLTLTNQAEGRRLIREALGDRVGVVPYVPAGFDLAKSVADCYESRPDIEGIVLIQHGLITFGPDARTAYERHVAIVDSCERFLDDRTKSHRLTPMFSSSDSPAVLAVKAAPILRGLLAEPTGDEDRPYLRSVVEWRAGDKVLQFVNSSEAAALSEAGPATGDHLIRTGPRPMFVDNPSWSDDDALHRQLEGAVKTYREKYADYVTAHGGSADNINSAPRIVLMPGAGAFCWGRTKRDARIAADITEHTLAIKARGHALGPYCAPSAEHLYDMEYRRSQQIKLGPLRGRALEGQVIVISGGAGAIGASVGEVCAGAGGHVVLMDIDQERLNRVVERIDKGHGSGSALAVVADVTDEASVREGFSRIVRAYGGVDVVVPNAGIAHVAPIEQLAVEDFRRVLEVNAVGYMLIMREGIRILKRQGLGGHIIINASKNVFGPGKDFGAYSASKAAGHQLGKVAAIELAPHGIRVNMINTDAIFGDAESPSGLWATVGPQRARSRNMKMEDLPEYYRGRNLLGARIRGHHVGNAVVFFATNATPTTGATLPIDGGIVEAFPR